MAKQKEEKTNVMRVLEQKKIPYTACFVESWASKWGELVTGEEAVWD